MIEHKQYSLVDKKTHKTLLRTTGDQALFIRDGIKQLKKRWVAIYVHGDKRYSDEQALFEEIDRLKKVKDNIVTLERNNPNEVSNELRLLKTIAEMLDIEVQVEAMAITD